MERSFGVGLEWAKDPTFSIGLIKYEKVNVPNRRTSTGTKHRFTVAISLIVPTENYKKKKRANIHWRRNEAAHERWPKKQPDSTIVGGQLKKKRKTRASYQLANAREFSRSHERMGKGEGKRKETS